MLQVVQHQKTGELWVEELPRPVLKNGGILVRNVYSLINTGTERTSINTARSSLIGKAKSRPDLVKQVFDNVKREGVGATYKKVKTRLDSIKELGISSAGIVLESSTDAFKPGDRVACAGGGYASHAEVIYVPKNLAVKIPDSVSFEDAACTTVGAIALQGVRQSDVKIGEHVAVIGLGIIGLLTVQLLKASGCRVFGLDVSRQNFSLAETLGCDRCDVSDVHSVEKILSWTSGLGTDAVLLTAGTRSNAPLNLALQYARPKSCVVIVGDIGMQITRTPFYEKELDLRISCSYGPGRYDPMYEQEGIDYPVGYVRWTENRNMQAFVDLLDQQKISVPPLISHTFTIDDALKAYELVTGGNKELHRGILIHYPERTEDETTVGRITIPVATEVTRFKQSKPVVGFIGAGNFTQSNILPLLRSENVVLRNVATVKPVNAKSVAEKFGFQLCTTDPEEILNDDAINTVFIATHHDTHARFVIESLKRKKHVFVEKPLAINYDELVNIRSVYSSINGDKLPQFFVGFNRRFSPSLRKLKDYFKSIKEPRSILYRVNAGSLPHDHWMNNPGQGGRIIGEGCHFIDCMVYLTGERPVSVYAQFIPTISGMHIVDKSVHATIRFSNGSIGTMIYNIGNDRAVEKEYIEIAAGGCTGIVRDFTGLLFYSQGKRRKKKCKGYKGHREEIHNFLQCITGKDQPELTFDEIYMVTAATFEIEASLKTGTQKEIQYA